MTPSFNIRSAVNFTRLNALMLNKFLACDRMKYLSNFSESHPARDTLFVKEQPLERSLETGMCWEVRIDWIRAYRLAAFAMTRKLAW